MANEYYNDRKRLHLCTRCGKKDARTLIGKILCHECAQKAYEKAKTPEKKAQWNAYMKERVRYYKENGICPRCGKRKAAEGRVHCEVCLAVKRRAEEKRRREAGKMDRTVAVELGRCRLCYKPAAPGKKLCPECLEKAKKNLVQYKEE